MNCKDFNKGLIEYIENDCSGLLIHEMKEHMESCRECYSLYRERLEVKASFSEHFNLRSNNFTPQNREILCKLDNKYYKKSLISKIMYHFKRNKFTYSTAMAFAALLIFALPTMKNYAYNHYNFSDPNNNISPQPAKNTVIKHAVKGSNYDGQLLEIADPKKVMIGYSLQNLQAHKTTSEIAKSNGAVAAINGGGILIDGEGKEVCEGIVIHDGKVMYNNSKDENFQYKLVGFDKDGMLVLGRHTLAEIKELGIKEGISSSVGIPLIHGGNYINLGSNPGGVNPQTAIGQKADGTVLMLVINGRSTNSVGATMSDIQKIFLEYGAVTAVTLDGGSRSSMYYNGEVINKPSSPSGEQPVPSIFMIMQ